MSNIFLYPDLPPDQKVQMERSLLNRPFEYSLSELHHLLTTSFPFERLDRLWLGSYCELAEHIAEKSHLEMPRSLVRWVRHQRELRRKEKLSVDKQRVLNRIGFSWTPVDDHWQKRFDAFRLYDKEKSGSARRSLISWVSVQRQRWDSLSERQRKLLLGAGVSPDPFGKCRAKNLRDLEAFFEKNGNLVGLSIRLKKFCESMRRFEASGRLDPIYKGRLDRLNFKWLIPCKPVNNGATLWDQRYAQLAAYLKPMLPDIPPLRNWENRRLARWTGRQRQRKRWHRLDPDSKQKLAALNLAPGTFQRLKWNAHYNLAVEIHKKMKPPTIGAYWNLNKTVYRWLTGQKERWKN